MSDPTPDIVRRTRDRRQLEEWCLVLAAEGVPCATSREADEYLLEVPEPHFAAALRSLDEFDAEDAREVAPEPIAETGRAPSIVGLGASAVLCAAFAAARLLAPEGEWAHLGSAHAYRILTGEWWRTLTALTLHADLGHLAGNVLVGTFFLSALGRSTGPGVALLTVVAAGGLANFANAWLSGPPHDSLGASTGVFAAVGAMSARTWLRWRRSGIRGRRGVVPLGGGLAILAMLGVGGERTDYGAHILGLALGAALGACAAAVVVGRPRATVQIAAGLGAVASLATAWAFAWSVRPA